MGLPIQAGLKILGKNKGRRSSFSFLGHWKTPLRSPTYDSTANTVDYYYQKINKNKMEGEEMASKDGETAPIISPMLAKIDEVRGFDASTYSGLMRLQIRRPQRYKGDLMIVKKLQKS